jgi:hypothetical protein
MPLQRLPALDPGTVRPHEPLRPGTAGERARAIRPIGGDGASAELPSRTGLAAEPALGDVPAGADPNVWLGLSAEERTYFARLEAAGPLGYGPNHNHGEPALHRGRHLHIRV